MVLNPGTGRLALAGLVLLLALAATAFAGSHVALAHKDHDRQRQQVGQERVAEVTPTLPADPDLKKARLGSIDRQVAVEPPATFAERLVDWIGRLHPLAVHFPIAGFPIGWFALTKAGKRGEAPQLVRAILVFTGLSAVAAALLGWLDAGFALANGDWILNLHRWTGTLLGLIGGAVAALAWRVPSARAGRLLTWVMAFATALILLQGWLGGALVHGADHLDF